MRRGLKWVTVFGNLGVDGTLNKSIFSGNGDISGGG